MSVITPSTRPDVVAPLTEKRGTGPISPWLGLGLLAGPLFLVASLVQAVLRPGFDITRNAVSELSLGSLGWIQDLNFAVAGMLSLAAAVGAGRVLRGSSGGVWIHVFSALSAWDWLPPPSSTRTRVTDSPKALPPERRQSVTGTGCST